MRRVGNDDMLLIFHKDGRVIDALDPKDISYRGVKARFGHAGMSKTAEKKIRDFLRLDSQYLPTDYDAVTVVLIWRTYDRTTRMRGFERELFELNFA